jgi:hypothetical protein
VSQTFALLHTLKPTLRKDHLPTIILTERGLPTGTSWTWALANALAMAALVQLTTPLTGPLGAGLLALAVWLGAGTLHNLQPGLSPYLPTSS